MNTRSPGWSARCTDLKPKTRHQYNSLLALHILPTWRTVPLAKVTFEGLAQWVARLSLGGLGPSGVRQSVFVMSAALDHAEIEYDEITEGTDEELQLFFQRLQEGDTVRRCPLASTPVGGDCYLLGYSVVRAAVVVDRTVAGTAREWPPYRVRDRLTGGHPMPLSLF